MKQYHAILAALLSILLSHQALAHDSVVIVPMDEGGPPAAIPKTGQTLCYDVDSATNPPPLVTCSNTGQDGDLQKGHARPVPRFTDLNDGTVRDNLTHLIWLKNADCRVAKLTMQQAYDYVANLNIGFIKGNCGDLGMNDDWRIPNRFELESLLDLGEIGPPITSGHPFQNVRLDYYWSSSYNQFYGPTLGVGWAVQFSAGVVQGRSWKLEPSYLWPVRGGD